MIFLHDVIDFWRHNKKKISISYYKINANSWNKLLVKILLNR